MRELTLEEREEVYKWAEANEETNLLADAYIGTLEILIGHDAIKKAGCTNPNASRVSKFAYVERDRIGLLILEKLHA